MNLQVEYVSSAELVPMPGNPRRNEKAIPKVAESIKRFGWTNPILARRSDRVVVAGHTRLAAAKHLGVDKVPVIWLDLDPVGSRLYNLADNQLSTIAEWDQPLLADMIRDLLGEDGGEADLAIAGFDEDELDRLLDAGRVPAEGETDPDDVPETPTNVYVKLGQTYRLGDHFIACGDSTVAADIDRVMQGAQDYHPQYEPIWYGWKEGAARLHPVEDRKQSDVWQVPRPKRSDEHPTMKPVELITRALYNSSSRGDIVFEPFSGSGSTIIACEQTGRACRAVELEPRYVQVAIERWEKFTGRKAELVKTGAV